jgi:pyruvate,water dikinase
MEASKMADKWIFWFKEIGKDDSELVGKKCANLGEMTKMGMPVPQGFCLSLKAQEKFVKETNASQEMKQFLTKFKDGIHKIKEYEEASQGLRQILESKKMPRDMEETILSYYKVLGGKSGTEAAVAVRSAGTKSHPGQYETYLNVRGGNELLSKIKMVWASIFNMRTIASLDRQHIPVENSPYIGVCILEMVNARCAGVGFTGDPMSGDLSKIIIEGNWGLGESVVSGAMTPDSYTVDKNTLKILQKNVGDKGIQVVTRDGQTVEEELPSEKRLGLCLNDEELVKIAEMAKALEDYFGTPQDMEWAISSDLTFPDNIFLLQTRPARILSKG